MPDTTPTVPCATAPRRPPSHWFHRLMSCWTRARWHAVLLGTALAAAPLPAFAAAPAPAYGRDGMVVSSQADASRAGLTLLQAGGNAVDAAIATAFAVSVTQPFSTGLGGGAFVLIRRPDGSVIAIDARETAPAAATRDMYVEPGAPENGSLHGPLAAATPGLVAGLALALERYGTKSLAEVLEPAYRLAYDGFAIGPYHAAMIERMRRHLPAERFPETARIQYPAPGETARPGWRLVQKDLAKTLLAIAAQGPDGFYRGPVAQAIAADQLRRGGLVTRADLEAYRPVVREPVQGEYRGLVVHSFPPPSSGGATLVQMLNILEDFDLAERGAGSSASLHVIAEASKLAFADRNTFMGDPDFVEIPLARLVSKPYAAAQRARINPPWFRRAPWRWLQGEMAIRVEGAGLPLHDAGTTHLSVTDAEGGAVAITKTINTPYGSGITVPGTGVILNNEMDDFSKAIGVPNVYGLVDTRGANAIAPKKRPLSSMTPTILERDDKLFMVTGSPGGPRIITTTLLTILNVVDFGMDVQEAVAAPRFHHQWLPDKIFVEPETPRDVVEGLRRRGHEVDVSARHWSSAEAIVIDPETGWHRGGTDPRRDGRALGYSRNP
ncbi:MAG: gamma-glutamyltransferase [Proteobacteria bacterium]|nr:gamma-glutamyltransferase [Pseudomonadota bacterium]